MNRLLLAATLTVVLVTGCGRQEPAAALPPASEAAVPAADATVTTPEATPTPVPSGAALAPSDDRLVNAAIDKVLGDHRKYQAVIEAYQEAVASGDRDAVAALVRYPLEVTLGGRKQSIQDAASFVQHYDAIITPVIARVITAQEYTELVVNQQGVMFGSGETWINGICKRDSADCSEFEARIVAIQAGGAERGNPATPP